MQGISPPYGLFLTQKQNTMQDLNEKQISKKEVTIGDCVYSINYDQVTAANILNKVIDWLENPKHYAASSGEGIMQSDNTVIDAPDLICDIVDNILKPQFIKETN